MDVLTTAATIGLTTQEGVGAHGTVEEAVVLAALAQLADDHPDDVDLIADAAARVQSGRSAGVERIEAGSVFAQLRTSNEIQLRYRAEVFEVFMDLAIDLALRHPRPAEAGSIAY